MGYREVIQSPACLTTDPEEFFHEDPTFMPPAIQALCDSCPVRELCLQLALDDRLDYGIFGGQTPAQRATTPDREWCANGHRWADNVVVGKDGVAKCGVCRREEKRSGPGIVDGVRVRCRHGHDWTPDNLITRADGSQRCKRCLEDQAARAHARMMERTECTHGHPWPEFRTVTGRGRVDCRGCRNDGMAKRRQEKGRTDRDLCSRGHRFTSGSYTIDPAGRRKCKACAEIPLAERRTTKEQ